MTSNVPSFLDLEKEDDLLALCIWREARGVSREAKLGVKWVIKNRCSLAPKQGFKPTISGNILKPFAFSSFNSNDPNSTKYPKETDPAWLECLDVVKCNEPDPTQGAVFYFSPPLMLAPRAWGKVEQTVVLDTLHFFKLPS